MVYSGLSEWVQNSQNMFITKNKNQILKILLSEGLSVDLLILSFFS